MSTTSSPGSSGSSTASISFLYELEESRDAKILDLEVQKRLVALSQELLLHFFTLMRTLTFHEHDNEAVQHNLMRFHHAIQEIFEFEYEIHIEFTGTDFLVNERWSKLARRFQDACTKLGDFLHSREIGGFWISAVPTPQQLMELVQRLVMTDPARNEQPFASLQTQLWQRQFAWITLEKYVEHQNWEAGRLAARDTIRQTYFQAIQVVQQLQSQIQQDRPIKLKSAKRVIQSMVDLFENPRYQQDLELLLHLTQLKHSVDYRYSHHVNVAVLSIGFGHHIGLHRSLCRDLGIAALLYDSGMLKLPPRLLETHSLSPQERQELERHIVLAIPIILHTSFIDSTVLRTINTTFAHHLGAREQGYPLYGQGLTSLAPQIIAIADLYDAMCTPKPYKSHTFTPTEALAEIARMPEHLINPSLSRQFVNWLSPLPLGTIVRMQEGTIAYVYKHPQESEPRDRPILRVLHSTHAQPGTFIDLPQRDPQGQFYWHVAEIINASHRDIQARYMLDLLRRK